MGVHSLLPLYVFPKKVGGICSYGKCSLKFVSWLFSATCPHLHDKMIGLLPLVRAVQVGARSGPALHQCYNSDSFWYCYVNNGHTGEFGNSCKGPEQRQSVKVPWIHFEEWVNKCSETSTVNFYTRGGKRNNCRFSSYQGRLFLSVRPSKRCQALCNA